VSNDIFYLLLTRNGDEVAIHRMRNWFREIVRTEIAEPVGDGAESRDELHYLLELRPRQQ